MRSKLIAPWNLNMGLLANPFSEIHRWVNVPAHRGVDEKSAHNFYKGLLFRDEEGYLLPETEGERIADAQREFSARRLWKILETEVEGLMGELERSMEVFGREDACFLEVIKVLLLLATD